MSLTSIISQIASLFIMIGIGAILNKVHIMNEDFNQRLTKILLNVTMPCMILSSIYNGAPRKPLGDVLTVFIVAFAMYVILPIISFILIKFTCVPLPMQGLYMFMFIYSNVGFMGFPIINAIYGNGAIFYTAIFNIMFNLSIFTLGIILVNYGTLNKAKLTPKKLLSPGILVAVLTVILYLTNCPMPEMVTSVISSVGNTTTPLAMIMIGSTLATIDTKSLFSDRRIYPYSIIKQFILPLLLWPLVHHFIQNPMIQGITLIMLMVPTANTIVLFATEYKNDEKLAAKLVFFTTLLSIVSIPLLLHICNFA